jgi:hypothetical protein
LSDLNFVLWEMAGNPMMAETPEWVNAKTELKLARFPHTAPSGKS